VDDAVARVVESGLVVVGVGAADDDDDDDDVVAVLVVADIARTSEKTKRRTAEIWALEFHRVP